MAEKYQLVPVTSVEDVGEFQDEYVYDIDMGAGNPYFFANDILVHNSVYISYADYLNQKGLPKTLEMVTAIADRIGDEINESFISYLSEQFLVPKERCKIVQAKRETIFDRAIFKDKKKRYAMHVLDKEGKQISKGHRDELKIVGMEVKRSDSPKMIQDFLQECLRRVLVEGYEEEQLRDYVEEFRTEFRKLPSWKRGSPVRVRNLHSSAEALQKYDKALDDQDFSAEKPLVFYVTIASRNTNTLIKKFEETRWESIKDGDKCDVLRLLVPNDFNNMEVIAIRVDETYIPQWFRDLPFNDYAHEKRLIDKKLENIFGGLGWDFAPRDHDGFDIFT